MKLPLLALLALAGVVPATAFAQNLILNGGAEDNTYVGAANNVSDFAHWTRSGSVYANEHASFPITWLGTPPTNSGSRYFLGGNPGSATNGTPVVTSLQQSVTLPGSLLSSVDAGTERATLSAFLASHKSGFGNASSQDFVTITVTYLAGGGGVLGSQSIGIDPAWVWSFSGTNIVRGDFFSSSSLIPVGTRSADVTILFTRMEGTISNGAVDNLSLTTETVPEPATIAALGLGMLALRRRRVRA